MLERRENKTSSVPPGLCHETKAPKTPHAVCLLGGLPSYVTSLGHCIRRQHCYCVLHPIVVPTASSKTPHSPSAFSCLPSYGTTLGHCISRQHCYCVFHPILVSITSLQGSQGHRLLGCLSSYLTALCHRVGRQHGHCVQQKQRPVVSDTAPQATQGRCALRSIPSDVAVVGHLIMGQRGYHIWHSYMGPIASSYGSHTRCHVSGIPSDTTNLCHCIRRHNRNLV